MLSEQYTEHTQPMTSLRSQWILKNRSREHLIEIYYFPQNMVLYFPKQVSFEKSIKYLYLANAYI